MSISLGQVFEEAVASALKAKEENEQANRRLESSHESLTDALSKENAVTNEATALRTKNAKTLQLVVSGLGDMAAAHYNLIKSLETDAKVLARGTALVGNNAAEQRKNLNALEAGALHYSKAIGASQRDSMQLVTNYQSTFKLLNGTFDKDSSGYLDRLGHVGKVLGASVEDLSFLQNDVLSRKGKFGKEFSKEVTGMMVDASDKFGMNVRESAEVIDDTLNRSLWMDQKAREKSVRMGLEGAALSKKAAVDFGKYASSLVGTTGVDAIKGNALISALTGSSMDEIDELRRQAKATPNGSAGVELRNMEQQAAERLLGVDDILKAWDEASSTQKGIMEEQLKNGPLGLNIEHVIENRRVMDSVGELPKLEPKTEAQIKALSDGLTTAEEAMQKGKATVQEKMYNLPGTDAIKEGINTVSAIQGGVDALGLTRTATHLLTIATTALTAAMMKNMLGGMGRGRGPRGGKPRGGKPRGGGGGRTARAGRVLKQAPQQLAGVAKRGAVRAAGVVPKAATALKTAPKLLGKGAKFGGKVLGKVAVPLQVLDTGVSLATEGGRQEMRADADKMSLGRTMKDLTGGNGLEGVMRQANPFDNLAKIGLTTKDMLQSQNSAKEATINLAQYKTKQAGIGGEIEKATRAVKAEAEAQGLDIGSDKRLKQLVGQQVRLKKDPFIALERLSAVTADASWTKPDSPTHQKLGPSSPTPESPLLSPLDQQKNRIAEDSLNVQKKMLAKLGHVEAPTLIQFSI